MSWKATAYVKEVYVCPNGKKITRSEKLLLFVLADYHNPERNIAWPSVKRLAAESLMSSRQAQRVIVELEQKGILEIDHGGNGRGDITRYVFTAFKEKKGDTMSTLFSEKGDISDSERVTFPTKKGDISGSVKKNQVLTPEKEPMGRFTPPTKAEASAYMAELSVPNPDEMAEAFVDHHEARGWILGGQRTQMKSWKAAVRTWKRNESKFSGGNGNGRYLDKAEHRTATNAANMREFLRRVNSPLADDLR